jgi:hypothetical protein
MAKTKNSMSENIVDIMRKGTAKWTRTRKAEERSPSSRSSRTVRMTMGRSQSVKDAAAEIMESAYMKASGNGTLPANARQIMYAARGYIQEKTGKPLESNYFTQTLLPNYVLETGVDWNVIYDARGHFTEPHTDSSFGIGTLEVRNYLRGNHHPAIVSAGVSRLKVETSGPQGRFGAVLFIEKEGFAQLFDDAEIQERYDIAIMSTKGMSVVAARALVDEMCAKHDIPLLLLHDFDKAGFSIAGTLQRDTNRYEFRNNIKVVDLGLSIEDVEAMALESEYQNHPKEKKEKLIANLRKNGATDRAIEFMFRDFDLHRSTRRVELNAMTSPQFIEFIERKLQEYGVKKVIPDRALLADVYTGVERARRLERAVAELDAIDVGDVTPPSDLEERVQAALEDDPLITWEDAVAEIVDEVQP